MSAHCAALHSPSVWGRAGPTGAVALAPVGRSLKEHDADEPGAAPRPPPYSWCRMNTPGPRRSGGCADRRPACLALQVLFPIW
jgi:hypothetical protein